MIISPTRMDFVLGKKGGAQLFFFSWLSKSERERGAVEQWRKIGAFKINAHLVTALSIFFKFFSAYFYNKLDSV